MGGLDKAVAHAITHMMIDIPLAFAIIRIWVLCGFFEMFDIGPPSWKQSIGAAFLLMTLGQVR